MPCQRPCAFRFQSTPSPRRETELGVHLIFIFIDFNPLPPQGGRPAIITVTCAFLHFNPLPPQGGRLRMPCQRPCAIRFQSTPSPRRETWSSAFRRRVTTYFNPLPPQGGRLMVNGRVRRHRAFQSTPSPRRETTCIVES